MKYKTLRLNKSVRTLLVLVLFALLGIEGNAQPTGAINGLFSVSAGTSVYFSKGNLQYQASTGTWRFAEHQWDYVGGTLSNLAQVNPSSAYNGTVSGSSNNFISSTYSGWIDLFGYGTSGWNSGAVCYQPWSVPSATNYNTEYLSENLVGAYANADWGVYNAISNGGNQTGLWRTPTIEEWQYLLNSRPGIRYARAIVNGVCGVIMLPDGWNEAIYALNKTNKPSVSYDSNVVSAADWTNVLEANGAVFFPCAGVRGGTSITEVNAHGEYWSSSAIQKFWFYYNTSGSPQNWTGTVGYQNHYGLSVRLVYATSQIASYSITTGANPSNGGSVSGGGSYQHGSNCTVTAIANPGYIFINWMEDGTVVSASATYSFTVTGNRNLVANFQLDHPDIIVFADLNVKALCVANWDTNGDGELSYAEAAAVTSLGYVFRGKKTITSFEELQYFTGLTSIGNYAFYDCTRLTGNLYIPNSVTSIGTSAFDSCCGFTGDLTIPNSVTSIGETAFYYCSGFTGSLTIPNSVSSIGGGAFSHTGFTSMTVSADTPPTLGQYVFSGISQSIPVHVPCGSLAAYQAANGWSEFTNYQCTGTPSYQITSSCNPAEGGTVSGAGTYQSGSTCTLTATANTGYSFVRWTKNGSQVSTSPTYSFTVTENATYVAVFNLRSYIISASANPSAGGSVSGGGTFNYGSTCTLTATANTGYSFANWTKNGTVVSTSANYSFTVSGSGTYVANFNGIENVIVFADPNVKAICVANWDTNGSGELSYTEAAAVTSLGEVFRGNTTITSFEELQYFTGLTSISDNAFRDCSNLTGNLNIPSSVTSIGNYAFYHCYGFTGSLTIPNSVTSIGYCAFSYCSGFTGALTISNSVTSIGYCAFYGCSGFTGSLTIPNSVTSIGDYAFRECSGFTGGLTIPNSVSFIGVFAFFNCSGFTGSLTIPNSITSIGIYTFYGCSGFTSMTVLPEIPPTLGQYAFSGISQSIPVYVPCGSLEAYQAADGWSGFSNYQGLDCPEEDVIVFADPNVKAICVANWDTNGSGELSYEEAAAVTSLGEVFRGNKTITSFEELQYFTGLTSIGNVAFLGCSGFTGSLTIPNSVTSIGNYAFYGCSGFTGSLTIPNSVSSIGGRAFCYTGFTSMTVSADTPPTLGVEVFVGVPNSIPVYVPCGSLEAYQAADGWSEFTNYQGLDCPEEDVIVFADPNVKAICVANWDTNGSGELSYEEAAAVTSLGEVFRGNTTITSFEELQYFTGLTSISDDAFRDCSNLTGSLYIPNAVISIGNRAFYGCSGFTGDLTISNSVTSIGNYAFYGCSGFNGGLTIPNSVTSIGTSAFFGCNGFTGSLTLPNSVTSIGEWAFYNCSGFTGGLTIPNSITSIGTHAFYNCSGFTGGLTIPNSVTSIGFGAFYECRGFTGSLTIPNSVSSIESYAFCRCNGFTSMTVLPETPPTLGQYAFSGISQSIPVYVPCGSLEAYQAADGWSGFTNYQGLDCPEEDVIVFADPNVKAICVANWDTNGSGELSYEEAAAVTDLGLAFSENATITSFEELQYFTGLASIGENEFVNCVNLTSLKIPNSVTSIGGWAFSSSGLLSITIPSSVTYIHEAAFRASSQIQQYIVESGNTVYDSRENCNAIIHTSSNKLIAACDNTSIPNSVASIGKYVFGWCFGLTSVTIPGSVTSIGNYAFCYCSDLTSMTVLAETPPTLGVDVFVGVPNSISVNVLCGSLEAYQTADGWSEFTNYHGIDCPTQTQTVSLSAGTNWISFNVETDLDAIKAALLNALRDTDNIAITIQGKSQNTKYTGGRWRGSLDFDVTQMYMIDVSADCEITLEGTPVHPSERPITIVNGANWIAYPLNVSMTQEEAFAGFNVVNGDVISSKGGNARYTGGRWRGTVTLTPGQGYIYTSAASGNRVLTFPGGAKTQR
jgi:hypothetical protein